MTKVEIKRKDFDWNITVRGHANYASHGKDIVCASISMLCCLMQQILIDDPAVMINTIKFEDGDVEFDFNTYNSMVIHLTFRELIKGFDMISNSYPDYCSYSLECD